MTGIARLALKAYPPSFRERYGDELAALVDELPATSRTTVDLLVGAARAWLRPRFGGAGSGRRLQASVCTVWVAWCAGFLVAPAINRALLDPPTAGASHTVRTLLQAAYVLFFVGWGVAAVGAVVLVIRGLLPALRSGAWQALRPLMPALALGVVEVLGLIILAPFRAQLAWGLLWVVGFAGFVACLAVGPPVTLSRLKLSKASLRAPTLLTVPLGLTLAALTGCSMAAAVLAGDASIASSAIPVVAALVAAAAASLIALVSSTRGMAALRAADAP